MESWDGLGWKAPWRPSGSNLCPGLGHLPLERRLLTEEPVQKACDGSGMVHGHLQSTGTAPTAPVITNKSSSPSAGETLPAPGASPSKPEHNHRPNQTSSGHRNPPSNAPPVLADSWKQLSCFPARCHWKEAKSCGGTEGWGQGRVVCGVWILGKHVPGLRSLSQQLEKVKENLGRGEGARNSSASGWCCPGVVRAGEEGRNGEIILSQSKGDRNLPKEVAVQPSVGSGLPAHPLGSRLRPTFPVQGSPWDARARTPAVLHG